MEHPFKKWDRGEHTYSEAETGLMKLDDGTKIGDVLSTCTICPVHNRTCSNYFTITTAGLHPEIGIEERTIMICSLGVEDIDRCPLSK